VRCEASGHASGFLLAHSACPLAKQLLRGAVVKGFHCEQPVGRGLLHMRGSRAVNSQADPAEATMWREHVQGALFHPVVTEFHDRLRDRVEVAPRCRYHRRGYCREGSACPFSHEQDAEEAGRKKKKKRPLGAMRVEVEVVPQCRYHRRGYCRKGSACPFAHEQNASEKARRKKKRPLGAMRVEVEVAPRCKYDRRGYCREGSACPFSHEQDAEEKGEGRRPRGGVRMTADSSKRAKIDGVVKLFRRTGDGGGDGMDAAIGSEHKVQCVGGFGFRLDEVCKDSMCRVWGVVSV